MNLRNEMQKVDAKHASSAVFDMIAKAGESIHKIAAAGDEIIVLTDKALYAISKDSEIKKRIPIGVSYGSS